MKTAPKGSQAIHCTVSSCEHNHSNSACALQDIQVSATPYGCTGKACDESMCSSFRTKA